MVAVFIRPEKEELIQENTVQPELKDRPHGQPVLFVFYQDGRRLTCRISKTAVLKRNKKISKGLDEYKSQIQTKFTNLYSAKPFSGGSFKLYNLYAKLEEFEPFLYDTTYKRLISALDIYLELFFHEDNQLYRASTIVMRYEDCAMLGVLTSVANCIARSIPHAMMICSDATACQKMAQMLGKESEEIIKQHSYLPYARAMNLVARSGYSVTINKSFHSYYMILLASLGNQRGKNGVHIPRRKRCFGWRQ
ncbi:hypothetical protein RRG08_030397 [Elysia crispata]|uniref:Rhabdovirus nucleocapsid domain-containing protein n=1 Tax=Elysia crispata TaxID=231223 RepID=A0AAE0YG19_9GAST|nr:hypothetical protein RRG08_030397 [Elysia crispata]